MSDQRIILDGSSHDVRAYLAAIVGPTRRPFGVVRTFMLGAGEPQVVARASGDTVLFVSVAVSGNAILAFSRNSNPSLGQDVTVAMQAASPTTFVDAVLMPGEELAVVSGTPVTATVVQVPF